MQNKINVCYFYADKLELVPIENKEIEWDEKKWNNITKEKEITGKKHKCWLYKFRCKIDWSTTINFCYMGDERIPIEKDLYGVYRIITLKNVKFRVKMNKVGDKWFTNYMLVNWNGKSENVWSKAFNQEQPRETKKDEQKMEIDLDWLDGGE